MGIIKRIITLGLTSRKKSSASLSKDNFEVTRVTLMERSEQLKEKQDGVRKQIQSLQSLVKIWNTNIESAETRLQIKGDAALSPMAQKAVESLLVQAKAYKKATQKNLTQLKTFHGDLLEKQNELSKVDIRLTALAYSQTIQQSFRAYSNEEPDPEMLSVASADEAFLRELRQLEYSTEALIAITVGEE